MLAAFLTYVTITNIVMPCCIYFYDKYHKRKIDTELLIYLSWSGFVTTPMLILYGYFETISEYIKDLGEKSRDRKRLNWYLINIEKIEDELSSRLLEIDDLDEYILSEECDGYRQRLAIGYGEISRLKQILK